MTTEPLTVMDTAWLRMDQPTNPMVITAVLVLAGAVPRDAILDRKRPLWQLHIVDGVRREDGSEATALGGAPAPLHRRRPSGGSCSSGAIRRRPTEGR